VSGTSTGRELEHLPKIAVSRENGRIPKLASHRSPSTRTVHIFLTATLWGAASSALPLFAAGYDEMRAAAVGRCEAIDPSASQSGLAFNPDGFRSYYVRSECLQTAAVLFRDEALCDQVKERVALLWSSWGYSPKHCRELVQQGVAEDRRTLEEMKSRYAQGGMKMTDFRVQRNGNGRDYDIIPAFSGTYGHGYQTTFEIVDPDAGNVPVLLYSSGHYVDATSRLQLYVVASDVRRRFPGLRTNRSYAVRASLRLDVGNGGPSGCWSDRFIEQVFPVRERTQSLTKQIVF